MLSQRLFRSRGERMIAGVCGGIAQYFAVDPTLVRLFAVLAAIFSGGVVLVLYVVLWVVVPEERFESPTVAHVGAETSEANASTGAAGSAFGSGSSWSSWSSFGGFGYSPEDTRQRRNRWMGWALLALGVLILGSNLHLFSWVHWNLIWPLFLILGGFFLLTRPRRPF